MSLQWDITEIENQKALCWIENTDVAKKEGENYILNPITEALIHLSMFTGINRITQKNYKELSKRLVELEILGIAWLPQEAIEGTIPKNLKRNPRQNEVKLHIGLRTNVSSNDNQKWGREVKRILREQAEEFIRSYDDSKETDTEAIKV